eukprot:TRINITY_DN817_c0_g1_i3.p1 TRINITY_DN817_c0_g1~~TRINITY_DN817_c0_g1_i3.p1  ORF type:complete len:1173 (+),score=313.58 TRINITY_DN817_c0_g1_i3:233-3751(+)
MALRALSFRRIPTSSPRPPTLVRVYSDITNDSYWTIAVTTDTTARALCDIIATKTGEDDYFMLFVVSKGRFSKKSEIPLGGNEIILDVDQRERKKDKNYKFLARMISRSSGSPVKMPTNKRSLPSRRGTYSAASASSLLQQSSSVHHPTLYDTYSVRSIHAREDEPTSPAIVRYSHSSSELNPRPSIFPDERRSSIFVDERQVERTEVVTSTTITPNYTVSTTSTTTFTRATPPTISNSNPLNITPPSPLNLTPPQRAIKVPDALEDAIVVHQRKSPVTDYPAVELTLPSVTTTTTTTTSSSSYSFNATSASADHSSAVSMSASTMDISITPPTSSSPPRSTSPAGDLSSHSPFAPRARSALLPNNRHSKRHSASPGRLQGSSNNGTLGGGDKEQLTMTKFYAGDIVGDPSLAPCWTLAVASATTAREVCAAVEEQLSLRPMSLRVVMSLALPGPGAIRIERLITDDEAVLNVREWAHNFGNTMAPTAASAASTPLQASVSERVIEKSGNPFGRHSRGRSNLASSASSAEIESSSVVSPLGAAATAPSRGSSHPSAGETPPYFIFRETVSQLNLKDIPRRPIVPPALRAIPASSEWRKSTDAIKLARHSLNLSAALEDKNKRRSIIFLGGNFVPPAPAPASPSIGGYSSLVGSACNSPCMSGTSSPATPSGMEMQEEVSPAVADAMCEVGDRPGGYMNFINLNEIESLKKIGTGSFSKVFRGKYRGNQVAVKMLNGTGSMEAVESFRKEFESMALAHSAHLVRFYGISLDKRLSMVIEYCENGSLYTALNSKKLDVDWRLAFKWMHQMLQGVNHLHNMVPALVHRDLKSHNLLLDGSWNVKVADFGLSRAMTMTNASSLGVLRGTMAYCAPEIYEGILFSDRSDVFSIGVVMWEILTRVISGEYHRPYENRPEIKHDFQIIIQTAKEGMRPEIHPDTPPGFVELLRQCWEHVPEKRPSCQELLDALTALRVQYMATPHLWEGARNKPVPHTPTSLHAAVAASLEGEAKRSRQALIEASRASFTQHTSPHMPSLVPPSPTPVSTTEPRTSFDRQPQQMPRVSSSTRGASSGLLPAVKSSSQGSISLSSLAPVAVGSSPLLLSTPQRPSTNNLSGAKPPISPQGTLKPLALDVTSFAEYDEAHPNGIIRNATPRFSDLVSRSSSSLLGLDARAE